MKSCFRVQPEPVFPPSSYHDVMDAMSKFVLYYVFLKPVVLIPFRAFCVELEILNKRLMSIRRVVQGLPQANFDILRWVSKHLDKYVVALLLVFDIEFNLNRLIARVTDYEEHNHMTPETLAIVFSPILLRAPQNDLKFVMILNNMGLGLSHKLVKASLLL